MKYKVLRIDEPDFGCEERPDGVPKMDKVYLIDENKDQTCVEEEDNPLYDRKIDENDMVVIHPEYGMLKVIDVVAAVIKGCDENEGKIFATQRGYGDMKDGWEFPGGKVESGERAEDALKREIREELDTDIEVLDFIDTVEYNYPKFHLSMKCFYAKVQSGNLTLKEHEAAKWLTIDNFDSVDWLPADVEIVKKIKK